MKAASSLLLYSVLIATQASGEVRRYECQFQLDCSGEAGCSPSDFAIEFTLDAAAPQAFVIGNLGMREVMPLIGDRSVSFVEPLDSGASQSTTISADGEAVHSRHTILADTLLPSQLYGQCTVSPEG